MISVSFLRSLVKGAFFRQDKDKGSVKSSQTSVNTSVNQKISVIKSTDQSIKDFPTSPVSKRTSYLDQGELLLPQSSFYEGSFRIKLYRFLRDNIPILNSALWTWTRICASPSYFELKGSEDPSLLDKGTEVIKIWIAISTSIIFKSSEARMRF